MTFRLKVHDSGPRLGGARVLHCDLGQSHPSLGLYPTALGGEMILLSQCRTAPPPHTESLSLTQAKIKAVSRGLNFSGAEHRKVHQTIEAATATMNSISPLYLLRLPSARPLYYNLSTKILQDRGRPDLRAAHGQGQMGGLRFTLDRPAGQTCRASAEIHDTQCTWGKLLC